MNGDLLLIELIWSYAYNLFILEYIFYES